MVLRGPDEGGDWGGLDNCAVWPKLCFLEERGVGVLGPTVGTSVPAQVVLGGSTPGFRNRVCQTAVDTENPPGQELGWYTKINPPGHELRW